MYRVFILTVILVVSAFEMHPLHIAVTEVEYDGNRNALEVAHRIFLDDLQMEIARDMSKMSVSFSMQSDEWVKNTLKSYLKKKFSLKVDGKLLEGNFVGYEYEAEAIYIYVEYLKIRKFKSLEFTNQILLDAYDDQINLLHFKNDGETRSLRFDKETRKGQL